MRMLRLASTFALAVATSYASLLALPSAAEAQQGSDEDKGAARALGGEGQAALDKGDFARAEDRFGRADKLYHAPTLALGYARSLRGQKKYVLAQEAYNRIAREGVSPGAPPAFAQAVEDAKREVQEIAPKIGGLTITVKAAGGGDVPSPKVMVDDKAVNAALLGVRKPIDPGSHVVKVSADGFKSAEKKFDVGEGASVDAPITMEKDGSSAAVTPPPVVPPTTTTTTTTPPGTDTTTTATTPPPDADTGARASSTGSKTLAYVAFGVGGAGLITGGITGILAMGKKSDLDKQCNGGTCPASAQSDVDSYHSMGLISTIGFAVGIVGVGAGIYFLVTSPKSEPAPAMKAGITPFIGPGSIGAFGRF
jgi:hypothetical protein